MYVQTIVCFANSRKNGARCIAGKAMSTAGKDTWIRPVDRDATRGLPTGLLAYQDGAQPALLDLVRIPLDGRINNCHQSENHLYSKDYFWVKTGRLQWADIGDWLDTPQKLWALGHQSQGMLNNRVPEALATGSSLLLISVPSLQLSLVDSPTYHDPYRRVVVGEFIYHGITYRLNVTDPQIESLCYANGGRNTAIAQPVLCLSLGICFKQHHYKLIAGVIYKGRVS
jgi:hypothetical protein